MVEMSGGNLTQGTSYLLSSHEAKHSRNRKHVCRGSKESEYKSYKRTCLCGSVQRHVDSVMIHTIRP